MTPTSKRWLESLKGRRDGCIARLEQTPLTDVDRARRTFDMAYRDLYDIVIAEAERFLPQIEFEATLPTDEQYPSLRARLLAEEGLIA